MLLLLAAIPTLLVALLLIPFSPALAWRLLVTAMLLLKHGLLRLGWQLQRLWCQLVGRSPRHAHPAARSLRLLFEDLGPTYIKFGQIIASSPGLFAEGYADEFRRCLDSVRPFPFAEVQQILAEELGSRVTQLEIDPEPLAAASIAQVHAARLRADERPLVVKVQRPRIRRRITLDVRIMRGAAQLLSALSSDLERANLAGIVDDFAAAISGELDFVAEGQAADEFNEIVQQLGCAQQIGAPRVEWSLSSRRVLTMERFFGHNVDDERAHRENPHVDAEAKLLLGMRCWFQCMMFHGFFHGDVHAGNLMWLDDGRIGFLDFGIVGRFTDEQKWLATRYAMAVAGGQYRELMQVFVDMGTVPEGTDLEQLVADIERAYGPLRGTALGELDFREQMPRVFRMARKHRLGLPREFVLIIKQLFYFNRYAKMLAPQLNIFTDARVGMALAVDFSRAMQPASAA